MTAPRRRLLFGRRGQAESRRIAEILREETVGGVLLLIGAAAALLWANWPGTDGYRHFVEYEFGPQSLHLHLSVAKWAGDALLAIFFFLAGLEVKREFLAGDLRTPARAALPVAAAVGGMVAPALVYVAINAAGDGVLRGWAIPSATDIAFALAVLAVINTHLPAALRTFLLTLAVVDDLLAIVVIALVYTSDLDAVPLLLALLPLAAFGLLVRRGVRAWWLLLPLALATWALVHASGVHATVAGVLLAFTVPVPREHEPHGNDPAERMEHRLRPLSAGVAVPVFAFCSAGVTIGGWSGLSSALQDRVALGVVAGLVVGKTVGILATTWLVARYTRAELDEGLRWADIGGLSVLGGIGFTVSLLIGELAFADDALREDHVKIGVLAGSLVAAAVAGSILRVRNRAYRAAEAAATAG